MFNSTNLLSIMAYRLQERKCDKQQQNCKSLSKMKVSAYICGVSIHDQMQNK